MHASLVPLLILTTLAFAEDPAALKARLYQSEAANSLDTPDIKPWHLKASFQLFDGNGKPAETGTFEEWFAGPKLHKTTYTSPSYTNTELVTEEGTFKSAPDAYAPEMVQRLHDQIVHPLPSPAEVDDSTPYAEKKEVFKVPLDCLMLAQPLKNRPFPPLGLFPTFCFDRDKTSLRVSFDFGSMFTTRNKIGTFLGHSIVIDQSISLGETSAATSHLEQLNTLPNPLPTDLFTRTPQMIAIPTMPTLVSGSVIQGSILKKVNPIYPERAKMNHVSGTVIFHAMIGTDGRIHSLKIVSAPDPDLALAALIAVRQWTYKPYLLNGQPTDVDSTITVNFSFGPG